MITANIRDILTHKWQASGYHLRRYTSVLKVLCSVLIFYFVYRASQKINGELEILLLHKMGIFYSVLMCFAITLLSAWKWRLIADKYQVSRLPLTWYLAEQWLSQAIGLLLFGFVGADLYRSAKLTRDSATSLRLAGKIVLEDRIWAVVSILFLAVVVHLWMIAGVFSLLLLLIPTILSRWDRFLIFTLSFICQGIKIVGMIAIFNVLGISIQDSIADIDYLTLTALIEFAPISFEGFGVGHFGLFLANNAMGIHAYNIFFAGKLIFKFAGVLFLFKSVPKKNLPYR